MKIIIDIDTNNYENTEDDSQEWSVWTLNLATFQDWRVIGQTPLWTVDGDAWCGNRYQCEVNFRDELLLRCLIDKIKETCGDRLIKIMQPEWLESMKGND